MAPAALGQITSDPLMLQVRFVAKARVAGELMFVEQALVKTARYCPTVDEFAVTVSVVAVSLGIFVKPPPLSVCHWMEIGRVPLAEDVNVAGPPLHAVTSEGCWVIAKGVAMTVTVKEHVPLLPLLSRAVLST